MCLAELYETEKSDRAVLTNIAHIRFEPQGVEVVTLFGETKVIREKISRIDFLKSRVVLAE